MNSKIGVPSIAVLGLVIVSVVVLVSRASIPNVSTPDYSICQNVNTSFTITVSATSLSSVNGWQVNVTWVPGNLNYTSSGYGNPWVGGTSTGKVNYAGGSALLAYAFNSGSTYSNTGTVTLVTITFKILQKPMVSSLHITTSSEHAGFGTLLYDPNVNSQTYTTTDGSVANCVLGPAP